MNMINFIKKLFKIEEQDGEKLVKDERVQIVEGLRKQFMGELGFTKMEFNEILTLIDNAEKEIFLVKESLMGVNINNDNTEDDVMCGEEKIRNIGIRLNKQIKETAQKIIQRKKQIG